MSPRVPALRVAVGDRLFEGPGVDLPPDGDVDPPPDGPTVADLRRAIERRGGVRVEGGRPASGPPPVTIDCPPPGPGHAVLVDPASPPTGVTGLLAAAARARGMSADRQPDLEAAEAALADTAPSAVAADRREAARDPEVDLRAARESAATAGAEVDRFRERVAELRGRLQARRATGADTGEVAGALRAAAADLSEAETERLAAEQAHEAAERRVRRHRARRARRLRRRDRVDNLRRAVRRDLASKLHGEFGPALATVPGGDRADGHRPTAAGEHPRDDAGDGPGDDAGDGPGDDAGDAPGDRAVDGPGAHDGDPVSAALAAVRLADLDAPVIDATGRFPDAAAAVECLRVPVIRCHPDRR